jgi:hypothetical protein
VARAHPGASKGDALPGATVSDAYADEEYLEGIFDALRKSTLPEARKVAGVTDCDALPVGAEAAPPSGGECDAQPGASSSGSGTTW